MKKIKEVKVEPLMYSIEVYDSTRTWVTRDRDETDEWSADDLASNTSINGVGPARKGWYSELAIPFPLERGKEYFLVYVTYSTGDSFHQESGRIQYVDLFTTRSKAEDCAKIIEEHYRFTDSGTPWTARGALKKKRPKDYSEFSITYSNEVGTATTICPNWTGYFESIEAVTVETVIARYGQDDIVPEDKGLIRYRY